jgi:tetratricopeptide (TPR) repeat protein
MAAPHQQQPARSRRWWIGAGLILLTAAVFFPVVSYPFVNFDDPVYVLRNPHVLGGFKWPNLVWAFQGTYASNWHPVTWISHILDCQMFGARAGWHHLTNLALHAANVALLFWMLTRLTGAAGRSAVVAALFAIHPLHVESVAWVAERKDVLSGFFFMLTLGAYVLYLEEARPASPLREGKRGKAVSKATREKAATAARAGGNARAARWYLVSLICLALGLMSKPMLVTLPFVLLLLDYWPLRRLKAKRLPEGDEDAAAPPRPIAPGRAVLEKLPYVALVVVSCLLTMGAQKRGGAMLTFSEFPLQLRLENVAVSFARYLGKTLWPAGLSVFYPHPVRWPMGLVAGAVLLVLGISVAAFVCRRRAPYLFTGWFWFAGMLVPVIGIVQVGSQSMADRYMYLPAIGLFLAGTWGVHALLARFTRTNAAVWTMGAAIVAAFAVAAGVQVRYWEKSETLFRHAIRVTGKNAVASNNLGSALVEQNRFAEAKDAFAQTLEIDPKFASAHANLGSLLRQMGDLPAASAHLRVALSIHPEDAAVHNDLGTVLDGMGDLPAALEQYEAALRLAPDFAGAEYNLAESLARLGRTDEAIVHYRGALRNAPRNVSAHYNLALTLAKAGRLDEARAGYMKALEIDPHHVGAQNNLGTLLIRLGQPAAAIPYLEAVVAVKADFPAAHYSLGKACAAAGQTREAAARYREALRLKPDWVVAMNDLAWLLATAPEENVRNGLQAVELAERVCALAGRGQAAPLATLAAAYAEAGQFTQAVTTAQAAYELVSASATPQLTNTLARQLGFYREGKPYHEAAVTNAVSRP